jgi:hypothetical protein
LVQRGELATRLLFRRPGQLLDARRHALIFSASNTTITPSAVQSAGSKTNDPARMK